MKRSLNGQIKNKLPRREKNFCLCIWFYSFLHCRHIRNLLAKQRPGLGRAHGGGDGNPGESRGQRSLKEPQVVGLQRAGHGETTFTSLFLPVSGSHLAIVPVVAMTGHILSHRTLGLKRHRKSRAFHLGGCLGYGLRPEDPEGLWTAVSSGSFSTYFFTIPSTKSHVWHEVQKSPGLGQRKPETSPITPTTTFSVRPCAELLAMMQHEALSVEKTLRWKRFSPLIPSL